MEIREAAEALLGYCREAVGENLRAVTRYSQADHEPIYTREDVLDELQLEEDTREMFRHPLVRMQKATWELSRLHPTLDDPEVAVFSYGNVTVVQFPILADAGLVVTLDGPNDLPTDFCSDCRALVYGDE